MALSIPFRTRVLAVLAGVLLAAGTGGGVAGGQAPVLRQPAPVVRPAPNPYREHLPEWMERHRGLTPQQQQLALASEPGFRQLPPETQQRMLGRLAQLNAMPPQQRTRMLERAEEMERLDPAQRQQVRGAMAELGRLPADRRGIVARAFRELREMPQNQRQAYLSSEYLHRALSPEERVTLGNLMAVEPLLPLPYRGSGPQP